MGTGERVYPFRAGDEDLLTEFQSHVHFLRGKLTSFPLTGSLAFGIIYNVDTRGIIMSKNPFKKESPETEEQEQEIKDEKTEEIKEESRLYWEQIEYYRKLEKETGANII